MRGGWRLRLCRRGVHGRSVGGQSGTPCRGDCRQVSTWRSGPREPLWMMASRSASENLRWRPTLVQGMRPAAAFLRSQEAGTCSRAAACSGVCSSRCAACSGPWARGSTSGGAGGVLSGPWRRVLESCDVPGFRGGWCSVLEASVEERMLSRSGGKGARALPDVRGTSGLFMAPLMGGNAVSSRKPSAWRGTSSGWTKNGGGSDAAGRTSPSTTRSERYGGQCRAGTRAAHGSLFGVTRDVAAYCGTKTADPCGLVWLWFRRCMRPTGWCRVTLSSASRPGGSCSGLLSAGRGTCHGRCRACAATRWRAVRAG